MNDVARRMAAAGLVDKIDTVLRDIAEADTKALGKILPQVEALIRGETRARAPDAGITFQQLGEQWTRGDLAQRFPDYIKAKRTAKSDEQRLKIHVYPHVGDVPVADFALVHAERVMGALPPELARASRRHVAQIMHRLLKLAVYPAKLITVNPLPPGFLPKLGSDVARTYLYPDEDAQLCASSNVPLPFRFLYGVLTREGFRSASEALATTRRCVDTQRGAVRLDKNKTDDPRAWALSCGVAAAFDAWFTLREDAGKPIGLDDPVFALEDEYGEPVSHEHAANRFRNHLKAAGITRPELFESSKTRRPIRLHDTRATFVTIALANGKSETWVADRTGHKSSTMIQRYRRAARMVEELGLGDLVPLVDAIPELAAVAERGKRAHDARPKR